MGGCKDHLLVPPPFSHEKVLVEHQSMRPFYFSQNKMKSRKDLKFGRKCGAVRNKFRFQGSDRLGTCSSDCNH